MFVKRDLIGEIGDLDAAAFPRGYGEENDFCMRALKAGWRNVIAPAAFVFHHRKASFGSEKKSLLATGMKVINKRYPDYAKRAEDAFSSPAIDNIQRNAARAAVAAMTTPVENRVAVLANVHGIKAELDDVNRRFFVPVDATAIHLPQVDAILNGQDNAVSVTEDFEQEFGTWLLINDIDRVEIQTHAKLPFDARQVCGLLGIPYTRVR